MRHVVRALVVPVLCATVLCATLPVATANAASTDTATSGPGRDGDGRLHGRDLAAFRLSTDAGSRLEVHRNGDGVADFVATPSGGGIDNPTLRNGRGVDRSAEAHVDRYGAMFGLGPGSTAEVVSSRRSGSGGSVARLQQEVQGLPVIGGELVVTMDTDGDLTSVLAETTQSAVPDLTTSVSETEARATAIAATAKSRRANASTMVADHGARWFYDPELIGATDVLGARTVWRFEVGNGYDVRELVLVDAANGRVALHFNQVAHALRRGVCDNDNVRRPGYVECKSGWARAEGDPVDGHSDVDDAYDFTKATSDMYAAVDDVRLTNLLGVVGYDGVKRLTSTVNWCFSSYVDPTCPMENAFWNGRQMFFGRDFASADDVVAHELTHGYTEKTSNLLYMYQSGAINESMSDVLGEIVDHRNGQVGRDDRWLLGEDLPDGALRDMSDPTRFGDPDRMRSPHYVVDINRGDNGGVHSNSGVGNKTAYLISQGGTFNGQTVIGIDGADTTLSRTAHLYVDVVAALTSGSDYADLGRVLSSTCDSYVSAGMFGFTKAKCDNVRKAVLATELAEQPTNADAQARETGRGCPVGATKKVLYADDVDTSGKTWTKGELWSTSPNESIGSNATSGSKAYFAWDPDPTGFGDPHTSTLTSGDDVTLPSGQRSYLSFNHWYLFEHSTRSPRVYYDGGFLSVRQAGTPTWKRTASMPWVNGPGRQIVLSNPGSPEKGFGGSSAGYQSSRLDLTSMAGQTMQMQFAVKGDSNVSLLGWFLDDIEIYTCPFVVPSAPRDVAARGRLGGVSVRWAAPAKAGTGVSGYRVTRSDGLVRNVSASARRSVFNALPGRSYSFTVRALNRAGSPGAPSGAAARATTTRLRASEPTITSGEVLRLSGALARAGSSRGVAAKVVELQRRVPGTARWVRIGRLSTRGDGSYAVRLRPSRTFEYRVTFHGADAFIGGRSGKVTARVR